MGQSFANETQIDDFDWIANNLIAHKLLINYLIEIKELIKKRATAHRCSEAVLKNQEQPLVDVL